MSEILGVSSQAVSSQGILVPGMTPLGDDPFSLAENLPGIGLLLAHSAVLLFGKRPSFFSLVPFHALHRTCCASEELREGTWGLAHVLLHPSFPQNTQKLGYLTEIPLYLLFSSSWSFRKQSHAVASCSVRCTLGR